MLVVADNVQPLICFVHRVALCFGGYVALLKLIKLDPDLLNYSAMHKALLVFKNKLS